MLACNYAFSFSAPAIVQRATGWAAGPVGYVIALYGLLGAGAMLAGAWSSDRLRERHLHVIVAALAMAASFLVCGLTGKAAILVPALGLAFFAYNAMQGAFLSIPGTFLGGKSAAAGVATINMVGILGGFFGPYWIGWAKDLTGDYQRGLGMLAPVMVAGAGLIFVLRRMAQRLEREKAAHVHS
jgi:ACS family tartrate transporter-like MFS transporter